MFDDTKFFDSIMDIVNEKQIDKEVIFSGIKDGIVKAYERFFDPEAIVKVEINEEKRRITAWRVLTVVEEVEDEWLEISLKDAKSKYKVDQIGAEVNAMIDINKEFSNLAVLKIGQIIKQKIREAEKDVIFEKFKNRVGELVSGEVKDITDNTYLIDIEGLTIPIWNKKIIPGESFRVGKRIVLYIEFTEKENKHQQVGLTRIHQNFILKLLEIEVPEISSGLIEVINIARDPGFRTKISVKSNDPNLDPIGCCVGPNGSRIKSIVSDLGKERIDVILYDENQQTYILNAMSPSRVVSIEKKLTEGEFEQYTIIVPDEHISLAIGRAGKLIRLIARLVRAKIDIISISQAKEKNIEIHWNGNLSENEFLKGDWLNNKNFRNWSGKNLTTNRSNNSILTRENEYDSNENEYMFNDVENLNDRNDDDFYDDQDIEDYILDDEENEA